MTPEHKKAFIDFLARRATDRGSEVAKEIENAIFPKVAPEIPASRILDEFGFPEPAKAEISLEDLELTKRFLGNLKDQTLSRGIFKILEDLLERLK